jgi:uncharacterized protein (UPF0548 family)
LGKAKGCDTGPVFQLSKPTAAQIEAAIAAVSALPTNGSQWLEPASGQNANRIPFGYARDFASERIGAGETVFRAARKVFAEWIQFDLGWVRMANPGSAIAKGQIVALEVRALGLWSLNLSRIVQTMDTPTQFGFVYATTPLHVEYGEERFLLEFDPQTGSVTYQLEAVSRPRNVFAQLGYPFTRAMQHRFARESLARVRDAVREADTLKI